MESAIESVNHKRLINRGFLVGPYIPIYGVGGVLFAIMGIPLKDAFDEPFLNIFLVFFVGMSSATLLEYIVGSVLERVFKKQFWDYSTLKLTNKFTYKNRISLVSSLFFGVLALIQTYFFYEQVDKIVSRLDFRFIVAVDIVMTLIMGVDAFIQIKRQINIHEILEKLPYEQLKEALYNNMLKMGGKQQILEFRDFLKNINLKNINENIGNIKKNIDDNIGNIKKNIDGNIDNIKKNIDDNIDNIKKNIDGIKNIRKQSEPNVTEITEEEFEAD